MVQRVLATCNYQNLLAIRFQLTSKSMMALCSFRADIELKDRSSKVLCEASLGRYHYDIRNLR